jgi:peroxiredoxin
MVTRRPARVKNKMITEEEKAKIINLKEQGFTLKDIAKEVKKKVLSGFPSVFMKLCRLGELEK